MTCALRLQEAVLLMAGGMSFTQAFAVETFGPILLVLFALWRTGMLVPAPGSPATSVFLTIGMGVLGMTVSQPFLHALLIQLPAWLTGSA